MVVRWLPLLKDRGNKTLGTKAGAAVNIEDMFSTYVYTGNSATQNIVNGIDLATDGGMVWIKQRNGVYKNLITDTVRGGSTQLVTNTTAISDGYTNITFNSNGMSLANNPEVNSLNNTFASWTFKKQPRFFDMVKYNGNLSTSRTLSHNLGVTPGLIITKNISNTDPWNVYHRSTGNTKTLYLNATTAATTDPDAWNNTSPTDTQFTIGENVNQTGEYIAYIFAHDPLGASGDGSDGMIACGSVTTIDSDNDAKVTLGWEPQYILAKLKTAGQWFLVDCMRGIVVDGIDASLYPSGNSAENAFGALNMFELTADGFYITKEATQSQFGGSAEVVYMAIRRGMSVCSGA